MRKSIVMMGAAVLAAMVLTACGGQGGKTADGGNVETTAETTAETSKSEIDKEDEETRETEATTVEEMETQTVTIAAAASLETCLKEELIPMFEAKYPGITIEGTYDSSGKLQAQIEEGAPIDVFFSAAEKQMNALEDEGMVQEDSIVNLLENKIVFIVPTGDEGEYSSFEDIAKVESVALGDPESVPVGQYSKEALENLGLWEEVLPKTSMGTNVTEVLNWVSEGSAKAGIVYATDAAQKPDTVTVVAKAPEGSVKKAIYPVGVLTDSKSPEGAAKFVEFLQTEEAMAVFVENGFAAAE